MHRELHFGSRRAVSLIELLVAVAILAVLAGLTLSAVQRVRAAAAAARCKNNLRQVGVALAHHHDRQGRFPPGVSWNSGRDPFPHMSWLTRLLPDIEHGALWDQSVQAYKQDSFFESPPHHPILGKVLPLFVCPVDTRCAQPHISGSFPVAFTSYLGVEGIDQRARNGILYLDSQTRLADIADGTSNTLLVGERPPNSLLSYGWWYAGWGQAKDGSADMVLGARELIVDSIYALCPSRSNQFGPGSVDGPCDTFHFWSPHAGGAHFLFADGSVRFLRYTADPMMPALSTRAGGEPAADLD